jgi:prolyl-tRNA synthetase
VCSSDLKSESEKFAGAGATYAVEALVQDGKAIQMGTSHFLGQNFSKVFNVKFMDQEGHEQYVWQTSWGVSTRLVGALIMIHSDDKGLVLPPKIAPIEVVILPVLGSGDSTKILKEAEKIAKDLIKKHLRVEIDKREQLSLGARIFEWEKKGVPVRIEIGPRDLVNKSVIVARRDTSHKESMKRTKLLSHIPELLDKIQKNLFEQAKRFQENSQHKIDNWDKFEETMNTKGGFILAHWCGSSKCEEEIKDKTKATIRCIPIDRKSVAGKCVRCGKESKERVFFAKAY